MPQQINLEQHWREAIDWLDRDTTAYFLTSVLNMGNPQWDSTIPTACVSVPVDLTDLRNFSFRFNPSFAKTLDVDELAFVAAHETLHIVLNHLALSKTYADKHLFNIAADCVINDWLEDQCFNVPDWVMTGDKQVGFNCARVTVSEVYNALQHRQRQGDDPQAGEPGEGSQNGSEGPQSDPQGDGQKGQSSGGGQGDEQQQEQAPSGGSLVDDHDWIHNSDQRQEGIAEAASDQTAKPSEIESAKADDPGGNGGGMGVNSGGAGRAFQPDATVTLAWEKLLTKVNPDVFKGAQVRSTWHRQPRRLLNSNTRLPERTHVDPTRIGKAHKPAIVVALDTSGSIQQSDVTKFLNLARSIPQQKIKVFPITFTRSARTIDLDNPQYVDGGTEFGCIETHIQQHVVGELKHYPKSVVVITDGCGLFQSNQVEEKNRKNWTWLYTSQHLFSKYADHPQGPNFGDVFDLNDFTN